MVDRAGATALVAVLLLLSAAFAPTSVRAASSTNLSTAGCSEAGGATFGSVLPGSSSVTTSDCSVVFGSSTDTSMLKLYQHDARGAAMWRPAHGELDVSFGTSGTVTTPVPTLLDNDNDVAVQPDGKIVTATSAGCTSGVCDILLTRYHEDGTLDASFDGDGFVRTAIGTGDDRGFAVAVQADGRILVAGRSLVATLDFSLARYDADGSLDTTFGGGDGIVTTDIAGGDDAASDLAVQPDGKIVLAGFGYITAYDSFAVARYTANGELDTNFDSDGIAVTDVGPANDKGYALALQTDGRIVVFGNSNNGAANDFATVRYLDSGALDTTFAGDGTAVTAIGTGEETSTAGLVQWDGKIVAAGYSHDGVDYDVALVRFLADGSLDPSFGATGKITTDIGGGHDYARSVVQQRDGALVVAGSGPDGATRDGIVLRYLTSGSLDPSFGGDGSVATPIGTGDDEFDSVTVERDGRILVAGTYINGATREVALARYDTVAMNDYQPGVDDWSTGTTMFGACVRSVAGVDVDGVWSVDPDATCTAANADPWNPIPRGPGAGSGARIAASRTSGTVDATVNLRFGLRTPTTQLPGRYIAPVVIEVYAPNVDPPVNLTLPAVTGTAQEGRTLTADPGTWDGSSPTFAWQWQRCDATGGACVDMPDQTRRYLTPLEPDIASTIRVVVTATNSEGTSVATSAATTAVLPAAPGIGFRPHAIKDGPIGYWRLGEASGTGADDSSGNGNSGTYASTGVTLGAAGAFSNDADTAAAFDGTSGTVGVPVPQVDQRDGRYNTVELWMYWNGVDGDMPFGFTYYDLFFHAGYFGFNTGNSDVYGISSAGLANRWVHVVGVFRNGTQQTLSRLYIDGAAQTLSQVVGTPLASGSVASTGASISGWPSSNGYGFGGRLDDVAVYMRPLTATEVQAHYDARTHALPSISGTAVEGWSVTAATGTWTSSRPVSYQYQWRRCDSAGGACIDIAGATSASYSLTSADVGSRIRVVVTGSNAGGSSSATSSAVVVGDGYRTAVLDDGPVGYWRLGEASATSAADSSGNGNTGTYMNGTLLGAAGPLTGDADTAARLDGVDDWIDVGGGAILKPERFSVEAWFRTTSTASMRLYRWRLYGHVLGISNGQVTGGYHDSAANLYTATSPATYNDGAWHHAVVTWDGANVVLYVDGAQVATAAATNPIYYGAGGAGLGRDGAGCSLCSEFAGDLDEVALYDRALPSSRVAEHHGARVTAIASRVAPVNTQPPSITGTLREGQVLTAGGGRWAGTPTVTYSYQWQRCNSHASATKAAAPIAMWRLNELQGVMAGDESGNGNDGTFSSGGITYRGAGAVPASDGDPSAEFSTGTLPVSVPQRDGAAGAFNTVSFWMYWTGTENQMPIGFDRYDLWIQTGGFGFNTGNSDVYGISNAGLANRWVHVVAAFNNGTPTSSRLWLDGVEQTLGQRFGTPVTRSVGTAMNVSGWPSDGNYRFGGRIDDVAVFSRLLTQAEIASMYTPASATGDPASCSDITGATSGSYTAAAADVHRRLRVRVTATNAAGAATATTTQTTAIVAIPPANTAAPTISGTARTDQTLTSSTGTWTGTGPIKHIWQWLRCDSAGNACVDIAGAIATTYQPTMSDVSSTLRVRVTATSSGGSTSATSPQTAQVVGVATFATTGAALSWTVPSGYSTVTIDVNGAQGGNAMAAGGKGGRVQGSLAVTGGETLTVIVGGQGGGPLGPPTCTTTRSAGGYNGGGPSGLCVGDGNTGGAGGGGSSEIRRSTTVLAIAGAGGGGGGWGWNGEEGGPGGSAGAPNGANGANGLNRSGMTYGFGFGGGGATQSAVGAGGAGNTDCGGGGSGSPGSGTSGGAGGNALQQYAGGAGGGGGGYFGGGGGTGACNGGGGGGGGGGSSWTSAGGATYQAGVRTGNGLVEITWV